jgi:integrase
MATSITRASIISLPLRSAADGSATTASTSGLSFLSIHDLKQSELRDFLAYKGGYGERTSKLKRAASSGYLVSSREKFRRALAGEVFGYLNGIVGDKLLAALDNPEARDLVARMKRETKPDGSKRFGEAGKAMVEYFRVFRCVIASARDDKLKPLYPREWDLAFIGLPKVNKRKQHRPTLSGDEMTHLVAQARNRYQMGAALLAGSNVRISELLALRIEKHISEDRKTMFIRQQRSKKGNIVKLTLKTDAAYRDIDLCSALARMLDDYIGDRKEGFLFQTRSGKMLSPESFYRDGLKTIFKKMGRTRVRFTAFRRFRESVLLRSECRQVLIDYWMGHENPDMSARYGRQLLEDVKYRKEWAEKVGLGFELPQASKSQASEPLADVSCATCATDSVEHVCVANA